MKKLADVCNFLPFFLSVVCNFYYTLWKVWKFLEVSLHIVWVVNSKVWRSFSKVCNFYYTTHARHKTTVSMGFFHGGFYFTVLFVSVVTSYQVYGVWCVYIYIIASAIAKKALHWFHELISLLLWCMPRSVILAVACLIDDAGYANTRVYSVKQFKDAMLPMSILTPNPSIISKVLVN